VPERDENASRRIGNRAVNTARTFFEENDLIFEEVNQRNDIGVDATLTLSRSGPDAGLSVGLQIKGGEKYKRKLHVDDRLRRRGIASFRSTDWQLWDEVEPTRGFEGHHVIDMDVRLRGIWRNSRPIYVIVQDPADNELYFGNLARMADVEPLEQDLVRSHDPKSNPGNDSRLNKYLASVYKKISQLREGQLPYHTTWIPLYPDLRLTPDGLQRFLAQARAEARQPIPDHSSSMGAVPIYVTYPDGTTGPSREVLEARDRYRQKGQFRLP
jgi:hypothetical protein